MPRYFFHIRDHDLLIADEEGLVLATLAAARHEAHLAAIDMLRDAELEGDDISHQLIELTDETGNIVATLRLVEAMRDF